MSAKHRKTARREAGRRAAIAAGAIGTAAGISFAGAPAQAAAPNYSQTISDYSHALDNFLKASNNLNGSINNVWSPIASPSGGLLPTFGSDYSKVDVTKISSLPTVLRSIADLNLPTGVPGVVPDIVLPGGQQFEIPLPASIPGGEVLSGVATTIDTLLNTPIVGPVLSELPPLSSIVNGLTATQADYGSFYSWPILSLAGQTSFLNTFVQTPSGLTVTLPSGIDLGGVTLPIPILGGQNLQIVPEGTLPAGTIWLPQGDGTYTFPLGAKAGWWGAMPTAALKLPGWLGDSETVISVPIYAAGAELPLNLAKFGTMGANVLLPTQNGVYSPVSATVTNFNSILPFGVTNLNVSSGNYIGTNGINVNNGQNLILLQNPLGVPLPLLYGLGGFSFGTEGMGLTSPSLFGIKLFSDIAIGGAVGPNSSAGLIPEGLLPTDPTNAIISAVTGGLGIGSLTQILGLDAIISPVTVVLGQGYTAIVTPLLTPLSDFATEQYGTVFNGVAKSVLDLSKTAAGESDAAADSSPTPQLLKTNSTSGEHRIENGGETVQEIANRLESSTPPAVDDGAWQPTQAATPSTPAPAPATASTPPTSEAPAETPTEITPTPPPTTDGATQPQQETSPAVNTTGETPTTTESGGESTDSATVTAEAAS